MKLLLLTPLLFVLSSLIYIGGSILATSFVATSHLFLAGYLVGLFCLVVMMSTMGALS